MNTINNNVRKMVKSMLLRWKYTAGAMNGENERRERLDDVGADNEVRRISKDDVRAAVKRRSGKVVGPGNIRVEAR